MFIFSVAIHSLLTVSLLARSTFCLTSGGISMSGVVMFITVGPSLSAGRAAAVPLRFYQNFFTAVIKVGNSVGGEMRR